MSFIEWLEVQPRHVLYAFIILQYAFIKKLDAELVVRFVNEKDFDTSIFSQGFNFETVWQRLIAAGIKIGRESVQ